MIINCGNSNKFIKDAKKPMIALTFDDGPATHTTKILDLLKKHDAHATFFVLGQRVKRHSEIVARSVKEGHDVLGHSWDHSYLTTLTEEEIQAQILDTDTVIEEITGISIKMFRPPYGRFNEMVQNVSKKLGFMMVNWSIDPRDWEHRDPDLIYTNIMDKVEDGGIVVLHDIHATTAEAMIRVIPDLVAKGYQLVSISELLSDRNIPITPGKVINHAKQKNMFSKDEKMLISELVKLIELIVEFIKATTE